MHKGDKVKPCRPALYKFNKLFLYLHVKQELEQTDGHVMPSRSANLSCTSLTKAANSERTVLGLVNAYAFSGAKMGNSHSLELC